MIDISEARLQPFQAFHSFHEQINIHIKVAHAANLLLVRHAGEPDNKNNYNYNLHAGKPNNNDLLADLITSSHPSWNAPPVRSLSIDIQRAQDSWISAFAVVSVFSAFDDFLIGTEAEVSRGTGNHRMPDRAPSEFDEFEDDEEKIDRVFRLYASMHWDTNGISNLQPVLRYFRLCRNCIAHRNGRASKALATQSTALNLSNALATLQGDDSKRGIMAFKVNEDIHMPPTLAIMCSHVLRLIAIDANDRMVETLGLDGTLKSVVHHAVRLNNELGGKVRKRPEAIVNAFLTKSRVRMGSRDESIAEMKRLGIWTPYLKAIS